MVADQPRGEGKDTGDAEDLEKLFTKVVLHMEDGRLDDPTSREQLITGHRLNAKKHA